MLLITGGTGFLGRSVAAEIPDALAISSQDLDLTDGGAVLAAIGDWQPTVVIHLAARVGGITANMEEAADFLVDNLRIDANVLAALRIHQPDHFITTLSTCMYPDRLDDGSYPMTEDLIEAGPPPPTNAAYASAKRSLVHGCRAIHGQYGVPYSALIPANLYGPWDHFGQSGRSHFLASAIDKVERARTHNASSVEFFGTGSALRQYVFAPDLARLIADLVERGPLNGVFNVAPSGFSSIRELAELVGEVAGYEGDITFSGSGPDGQYRKDVSSTALRDVVPAWEQLETPLDTGLRLTIDWYRKHVETG